MTAFLAIVSRDVALGFRAGGGAMLAAIFFALMILIFALAVGPDRMLLSSIAAPVLVDSRPVGNTRLLRPDFSGRL